MTPKTKKKAPAPGAGKKRESIYGGHQKNMEPVRTVGELADLLANLPNDLPLAAYDDGYKPVWFNVGQSTEHLSLEPNDGTWEEA